MFDTTVVAWDGTPEARAAAEWAAARSADGHIVLAHVAGRGIAEAEFFAADSPAARARVHLDEDAERLRRDYPGTRFETRLLTGDREEALVAQTTPRTLLVIGHRPRRTRLRWSFTARLAGTVKGTLAVVPAAGQGGSGIVVGVDGSAQAVAALEAAADEAERSGAEVTVVHAWQLPLTLEDEDLYEEAYLEGAELMREAMLEELIASTGARHPRVLFRAEVLGGPAAHALKAASEDAAMLVVGNRHRSLGARLFLGSVAAALIAAPARPTLIVNADLADLVPTGERTLGLSVG